MTTTDHDSYLTSHIDPDSIVQRTSTPSTDEWQADIFRDGF